MHTAHSLLVASSLLGIFACSGDTATMSMDNEPMDDSIEETDETAPTLLEMTPSDGAIGILDSAVVTLRFSEAMHKGVAEGLIEASSLGAFDFDWNDAGDTVTLTPQQPLAYATASGTYPDVKLPLVYEVRLAAGAEDLAGNLMVAGATSNFSTMRQMTATFFPDLAKSNILTPQLALGNEDDNFFVGDIEGDVAIRSAITFDIADMPDDEGIIIESASFLTLQVPDAGYGTPYQDLDSDLLMDHVSYDSLEGVNEINAAFSSKQQAHASLGVIGQEDSTDIAVDVTNCVTQDYALRDQRGDVSQYLVSFDKFTDEGDDDDATVLHKESTELQIIYLAP